MTPEEVLQRARANGVEFVDLRWTDLRGRWQHHTLPAGWTANGAALELDPVVWRDGRVRTPQLDTGFVDPFCQHPTLAVLCDVRDPVTGLDVPDDPRAVARRAEAFAAAEGTVQVHVASDLEFFVFDQVCFEQGMNAARYQVDSREGVWRRGRDEPDNLGSQLRPGAGAGPLPPADSLHNLRAEMAAALAECGVRCRGHGHGPATGGQGRLELGPAELVAAADEVLIAKYVARNVAARHGKVVTFMPQPLFGEHGSGLPVRLLMHQDGGRMLCDEVGKLTDAGRWAVGGLLEHAASLLAFTSPTTNSYKRLVPGFDAPTHRVYARSLPAALVHVPLPRPAQPPNWVKFRACDPSSNPYLAFSAIALAALDGIERRLEPGPVLENNLDELSVAELRRLARLPASLDDVLTALEADNDYLLRGDVFPPELIREWVAQKRLNEVAAVRARPHPYEFCLYFDA